MTVPRLSPPSPLRVDSGDEVHSFSSYRLTGFLSPQNVAPVPEQPTITVQEVVARKILKLREKLGINAVDLLPASVALEYEKSASPSGGDAVENDDEYFSFERIGYCVDVAGWKTETENMLNLLGSNADGAHDYPMTELKRKVGHRDTSPTRISRRARKECHRRGEFKEHLASDETTSSPTLRVAGWFCCHVYVRDTHCFLPHLHVSSCLCCNRSLRRCFLSNGRRAVEGVEINPQKRR